MNAARSARSACFQKCELKNNNNSSANFTASFFSSFFSSSVLLYFIFLLVLCLQICKFNNEKHWIARALLFAYISQLSLSYTLHLTTIFLCFLFQSPNRLHTQFNPRIAEKHLTCKIIYNIPEMILEKAEYDFSMKSSLSSKQSLLNLSSLFLVKKST